MQVVAPCLPNRNERMMGNNFWPHDDPKIISMFTMTNLHHYEAAKLVQKQIMDINPILFFFHQNIIKEKLRMVFWF